MKLLIILGSERVPTFIRNQIVGLSKRGDIEVHVMAKEGSERHLPGAKLLFSDFRRWTSVRILGSLLVALLTNWRRLIQAVRLTNSCASRKAWLKGLYRTYLLVRCDPTIIHFQWAAHTSGFAKLILSKRYKCLVSLRGTQINVEPLVNTALAEYYRRIFPHVHLHAVSEAMKQRAQLYGGDIERTCVVYSPVPKKFLDAFEPDFQQPTGALKVLSVGRFHWIKGYSYAIEAIHLLHRQGVNVEYTVAAQGEVPSDVLYQIKDRGLQSHIHLKKGVEYDDVIPMMKGHHVLLLSSVEEGIANVVLEAMAIGLPVITTDCGGMREVVEPGRSGWLVPVRQPAAIANALLDFMRTEVTELVRIRQAAHNKIQGMCDYEKNIEQFVSLYRCIEQFEQYGSPRRAAIE